MVSIFYKWILGDGVEIPYDVEEEALEETDEESGDVCYLSHLPLLRKLTKELPPEPYEEEKVPQTTEGGT